MNSCDVASQVWSYYSVSRYSHWRNWWPMLWLILDASIANVLYLYRLKGFSEADLSHRDLQTRIGLQLLREPDSVLRQRRDPVIVLNSKPSEIKKSEHQWIKAGTTNQGHERRGECVVCKAPPEKRGRRRKGQEQERTPLQELSTNTRRQRGPRSRWKCRECDVFLCRDSTCWQRQHLDPQNRENIGI
jgi:hypothetical protein